MNRFRQFMYGRYGLDAFSKFLIYMALIITLIGTILRLNILVYLSYVPLLYAIYRTLSKDINRRTGENYKFLNIRGSYQYRFSKFTSKIKGSKTHRYYKCPQCKQTIRVPRGKGKIRITCPKCRTEFIKRT